VCEQILNGDGAARRNDGDAGITLHRDSGLAEGWDEVANRLVQLDLAFLDEREHRRAGNCFRLGSNPKDRRRIHAPPGFLVGPTDSALIHRLAVAQHKRNGARNAVLIDVALQQLIDAGRTPGLQGGGA
jgi:hypothetical protein